MYLQGNLQVVFDALYHMGVIDPVLEMDWSQALEKFHLHFTEFQRVVQAANKCKGSVDEMIEALERFDETSLEYLAIEVAKEYADFHSREKLH